MHNRLPDRTTARRLPAPPPGPEADVLFMPLGYEPGYDYPLLVWLPDPAGRRFDLARAMKRLSLRNFVAVQPGIAADAADPEAAVWRAIDQTCDRASVHPRRIYLVGQGAGGAAAFRIACRHPQAFAGVISLGGLFPLDESLFARLFEVRRLPMLFCCRRDLPDEAAARVDRTLRLFHAAGAVMALRIYPGGNDLSKAVLGDVNRWIMDEVCGASLPQVPQCTR